MSAHAAHNRIVKAANTAFYTPHAHRWWGIIFCIFLCFQLMCNFLSVFLTLSRSPPPIQPRTQGNVLISWGQETLELQTNLRKGWNCTIKETAPAATIYWAHISSLHRYSRHYKFKLNFHERFHVHIQPQWIHVLILWSYHWKVNVKFIEQIQKNIFKLNLQMTNHINAF